MAEHWSQLPLVVLDTNVLVSALWNSDGKPFKLLSMVMMSKIAPCFDNAILDEYHRVLSRPKLAFDKARVKQLLHNLQSFGYYVEAGQSTTAFADEDDRKFYDVACYCDAVLITGNMRHYPKQPFICTPAEYLARFCKRSRSAPIGN
jgi:putative PIN family toxin of toxin-antitoxin system